MDQESLFDRICRDMDRDLKIGYKKASAGTDRLADAFFFLSVFNDHCEAGLRFGGVGQHFFQDPEFFGGIRFFSRDQADLGFFG